MSSITGTTDYSANVSTFRNVKQDTSNTGANFAVNDMVSAGTGAWPLNIGTVANTTGGRVVFAINTNQGSADNQIGGLSPDTGTGTTWTIGYDVYVTSKRTSAVI